MTRASIAFALIACSRPEPRPPPPDLGETMNQLDAIPGRVEALRSRASRQACDFALYVRCEYPQIVPKVSVKNLESRIARRK